MQKNRIPSDFPVVEGPKVIVMSAEVETGIVLKLDGTRHNRQDATGERYRIFDTLKDAEEFAASSFAKNRKIEFWLYDSDAVFIRRMVMKQ